MQRIRRARAGPRFLFLVHPLSPLLQRVLGVRRLDLALALGRSDGSGVQAGGRVAQLGLPGVAMGTVVSIGLSPQQMLADPHLAVDRMEALVRRAGPVDVVGLGSLCAVVAGRGEELARRLDTPVTTGAAATAWALWRNTQAVHQRLGGPVAVVGSAGPVGHAVCELLAAEGVPLRVDHKRGGRGVDAAGAEIAVCGSATEAVAGCRVVVGAGPTGASLDGSALASGAVVVDVAIPGTVRDASRELTVLAGEAVLPPSDWHRRFWGRIYQLLAGYGPTQVYACLVEPLVMAAQGRTEPYAVGRRVRLEDVQEFGRAAEALGFRPRLARGWRGVSARGLNRR